MDPESGSNRNTFCITIEWLFFFFFFVVVVVVVVVFYTYSFYDEIKRQ